MSFLEPYVHTFYLCGNVSHIANLETTYILSTSKFTADTTVLILKKKKIPICEFTNFEYYITYKRLTLRFIYSLYNLIATPSRYHNVVS